jgi:hypothetical protein
MALRPTRRGRSHCDDISMASGPVGAGGGGGRGDARVNEAGGVGAGADGGDDSSSSMASEPSRPAAPARKISARLLFGLHTQHTGQMNRRCPNYRFLARIASAIHARVSLATDSTLGGGDARRFFRGDSRSDGTESIDTGGEGTDGESAADEACGVGDRALVALLGSGASRMDASASAASRSNASTAATAAAAPSSASETSTGPSASSSEIGEGERILSER